MKRIVFFTIFTTLLLVVGSCKKKGEYKKRGCPPVQGVRGKWKMITAKDASEKEITDSIKQVIGGNLILEFVKRDGNCYMHAYVKETGARIYEKQEQEPQITYNECVVTGLLFPTKEKYLECSVSKIPALVKMHIPYISPDYDDTTGHQVATSSWIMKIIYSKDNKNRLTFAGESIPFAGECAPMAFNDGLIIFEKIK